MPIPTNRIANGVPVTEVGLGGAQLGNLHRAMDDEAARRLVDTAWSSGVRYFDTAPHYGLGLSERRLGECLAAYRRDEYVLSTKVGRLLVPNPDGAHQRDDQGFDVPALTRRRWDFSRSGVLSCLEQSLVRMGSDRIDVVYLHDAEHHWDQACREAFPTLLELREQGIVGAVGAGMSHPDLLADLVRRYDVDVVMCAGRYTLLEQQAAKELLPAAHARGTAVVMAGVFNSGLLSEPWPTDTATYDYRQAPADLVTRTRRLAAVCENHSVTLPQAAIAFPFRHPAVRSVVLGADSAAQLEQNVQRYRDGVPDDLWRELAEEGLLAHDPARESETGPVKEAE